MNKMYQITIFNFIKPIDKMQFYILSLPKY